jgi:hypothetical protein
MIQEPNSLISLLTIPLAITYEDGEGGIQICWSSQCRAHFLFVAHTSKIYERTANYSKRSADNYEAKTIPMVQEQGTRGTSSRQFSLKIRIPRTRAFEAAVRICWHFKYHMFKGSYKVGRVFRTYKQAIQPSSNSFLRSHITSHK